MKWRFRNFIDNTCKSATGVMQHNDVHAARRASYPLEIRTQSQSHGPKDTQDVFAKAMRQAIVTNHVSSTLLLAPFRDRLICERFGSQARPLDPSSSAFIHSSRSKFKPEDSSNSVWSEICGSTNELGQHEGDTTRYSLGGSRLSHGWHVALPHAVSSLSTACELPWLRELHALSSGVVDCVLELPVLHAS